MQNTLFTESGFAIIAQVVSDADCHVASAQITPADAGSGGSRCLLPMAWCSSMVQRLRLHPIVSAFIPPGAVAVQFTYFEKSVSRNWLVPWHQDLSIPVAERVNESSLRGWSNKEGMPFVQAPVAVLEQMVAVRLHLDECSPHDGPLRVIAGSHVLGVIAPQDEHAIRKARTEVVCAAERGAAVIMRPLLLHGSSKASGASRRRVLHFLFGPPTLPFGLRWHHAV